MYTPLQLTSSGVIVYIKSSILRANWNRRSNCCDQESCHNKHKQRKYISWSQDMNLKIFQEAIEGKRHYHYTERLDYLHSI